MATRTPVVNPDVLGDGGSVVQVLYTGLLNGDDGSPIDAVNWGNHADRSIEVFVGAGAFGAGGTLVWEGANDNTPTYQTLDDASGSPLSFTAAKTEVVQPVSRLQRPRVSAGDGTTNLSVAVTLRRQNPMRT